MLYKFKSLDTWPVKLGLIFLILINIQCSQQPKSNCSEGQDCQSNLESTVITDILINSVENQNSNLLNPVEPSLLLERISYVLTGHTSYDVLTSQQREDFLTKKISISEVSELLKQHPLFVKRMSEYWSQALGVTSSLNWTNNLNVETNKTFLTEVSGGTYSSTSRGLMHRHGECTGEGWNKGVWQLTGNHGAGVVTSCNSNNEFCSANSTFVNPYWDLTDTVRVCTGVAQVCGSNLQNCLPVSVSSSRYEEGASALNFISNVGNSLTSEAGILIAKIIQEDLGWNEVLTTTKGVVNGPFSALIKNFNNNAFKKYFPPNSYDNFTENPGINSLDSQDLDTWLWVERGPHHSGILTSYAFHKVTNGWRAKANKLFNSMLCREFKVDPSTPMISSEEQDLTKRPYCQNCHVVLEPFAAFFKQWPDVGNDNAYYYFPNILAQGSFNGQSGTGVKDLGHIVTQMQDYYDCAITRSFEFLVGRPMNADEIKTVLPPLRTAMNKNDKKLWPIMQEILKSRSFVGGYKK